MKKIEVRRYNFIVGESLLYSGLFKKVGFFGGFELATLLQEKRMELSMKYKIPVRLISVSNTVKG